MALIFLDGFDAYTNPSDATAGKWSSGSLGGVATGRLGAYSGSLSGNTLSRAFGAVATVIIGAAVNFSGFNAFSGALYTFYDLSANVQMKLQIDTFGRLFVYRGNGTTLLAFTSHFIALNTWNYIEFGITIGTGTSGAFTVKVNDQVILNNAACNTQQTSDTTVSAVSIGGGGFGATLFDDLYLLDTSGSVNNSYLGDMRVETLFPDGDASSVLTPINMMGNTNQGATPGNLTSGSSTANRLYLFRVLCTTNGTVTDGIINFWTASFTCKTKMVIYNDSAGVVGTLVTNGVSNEVIGAVQDVPNDYTFAVPPSVTAGTNYWIGLINDTALTIYGNPLAAVTGRDTSAFIANTYVSGAPASPVSLTYGTESPQIAVQIVGGTNFTAVNEPQEDQDYSYVSSNTPGDADVYTFSNLTADAQTVFGIQVSPMIRKTHTDSRTGAVTMQTPGMSVETAPAAFPGVNYTYFPVVFNVQSDGSTTWTVTAVNGIEVGIEVG